MAMQRLAPYLGMSKKELREEFQKLGERDIQYLSDALRNPYLEMFAEGKKSLKEMSQDSGYSQSAIGHIRSALIKANLIERMGKWKGRSSLNKREILNFLERKTPTYQEISNEFNVPVNYMGSFLRQMHSDGDVDISSLNLGKNNDMLGNLAGKNVVCTEKTRWILGFRILSKVPHNISVGKKKAFSNVIKYCVPQETSNVIKKGLKKKLLENK